MLAIWSFPPIFIKYLDLSFTPFVQTFYRRLAGAVILLPFLDRSDFSHILRIFKIFLFPAILTTLCQSLVTWGVVLSQANTAAFLITIPPVFVVPLAYVYIPREKSIVRKPLFIVSFLLVLLCAGLITLSKSEPSFSLGCVLLVISSLVWAIYTIKMKKILDEMEIGLITSVFGVVCLSTLFFFPLAYAGIGQIAHVHFSKICILAISGVSSFVIGRLIYHHLLKKIGAAVVISTLLSTPFITSILAFLILRETITILQLVTGAVVLIGCYFILRLDQEGKV